MAVVAGPFRAHDQRSRAGRSTTRVTKTRTSSFPLASLPFLLFPDDSGLSERMKRDINGMNTGFAVRILDGLFVLGVFGSSPFTEYTDIPQESALQILRELRQRSVLKTIQEKSGRQTAVVALAELIDTVEGYEVI